MTVLPPSMPAMPLRELILIGLYPCVLCAAIGTDIARRIIPNLLVGALLAGFITLSLLTHLPDLSLRLLVAGAVTALGFSLFSQGLIGAGDAKLAGALMLWLDPLQVPVFALVTVAICALLTLPPLLRRRAAGNGAGLLTGSVELPYAVALAGAGLLLHPYSSLMHFA